MAVSPIATVRWRDATLDHFSFDSNCTFRQKFLVHDAHWRHNRSGPLLMYFGNEGAIEDFWNASGALFELAPPHSSVTAPSRSAAMLHPAAPPGRFGPSESGEVGALAASEPSGLGETAAESER